MAFNQTNKAALGILLLACASAGSGKAATCSTATFSGVYGVLTTGFDSGKNRTAGIYQLTADGKGNVSGSGTKNASGTIQAPTVSGSYSIGSDCTGAMSLTDQNKMVSNYGIVFDEYNKGFQIIRTDSGLVQSGFGSALGTAVCGLPGKKMTFAVNLTGAFSTLGPISLLGRITFDGRGHVAGANTVNLANGTFFMASVTGTYAPNANCTGTLTITEAQIGGTSTFAWVAVKGGAELLVLETDASGVLVVAGTAQQ